MVLTLGKAMRRRDFIKAITISVAWPLTARAQQPTLPVVGVVSGQSAHSDARNAAAFYKGLSAAASPPSKRRVGNGAQAPCIPRARNTRLATAAEFGHDPILLF